MSIGEIVSMFESNEIIINPEFQRLFRWSIGQKVQTYLSPCCSVSLSPLYLFLKKKMEVGSLLTAFSGFSRRILEFMGKLRSPGGDVASPSILEGTKYLPSLHNAVWERSELLLPATPLKEQHEIEKSHQLSIRRARIGVEILKRPSDDQTKYDLFQRLNAGGTQANVKSFATASC